MDRLSTWKEQIARLDAALRPLAQRPVKFFELLFKPRRRAHPLDEAKVRTQAEQFLSELIEYYPTADADMRPAAGVYRRVPYGVIASIVFTLIYVLNPFDLVPDMLPVIGQMDDVAVLGACLILVEQDLHKYKDWKQGSV
jgi:uncharacterized membrane protein YkvA (DUF1232 family)